jgi:hypothetical protein
MELLQSESPLVPLYISLQRPEGLVFNLVDIGCSGGIDPLFLQLGKKLKALGIDASVDEIAKLKTDNSMINVIYKDYLVSLPSEHPFYNQILGEQVFISNNPWQRLAVTKSCEIRRNKKLYTNHNAKMTDNLWQETTLSSRTATLTELFQMNKFYNIDLLKIDIDGPDYFALQDLDNKFENFGILGVVMEVNYFGGIDETEHTFHNTDRFMRKNGFTLFGLTVRPYSVAALPFRYQEGVPCQSFGGRPFQGDAFYALDICAGEFADISINKLINMVLLFSLFGLTDCAAEILLKYKATLVDYLDTDYILDTLTEQTKKIQNGTPKNIQCYNDLINSFTSDSDEFYFANYDLDVNAIKKQRDALLASRWRTLGQKLGIVKK